MTDEERKELVEELRSYDLSFCDKAADEIERLAARIEDLERLGWNCAELPQSKAELVDIREALQALYDDCMDYIKINNLAGAENNQVLQQARAALAQSDAEPVARSTK